MTPPRPAPIRVLIVDDSLVIRHLIQEALRGDPGIEIVGAEANGALALERIPLVKPDVVTLDIEMPVMDGLETLAQIRKHHPRLRTIMFSTLTTRGAEITLEALASGADDYVTKAANAGSLDQSLANLRHSLIPKIKQFFAPPPAVVRSAPPRTLFPRPSSSRPEVIAIGVSTGGPQALQEIIPKLPRHLPLPVVIVQHMPPLFTRFLAERLDASSALEVKEAEDGMEVRPGRVILARGGSHVRLRRTGAVVTTVIDHGEPENSCRPSVDVLFRSVREVYGAKALALMLTGMGSDGMEGTRILKQAGALSWAQDQASSVVWGMPRAVSEAGLADRVLPLQNIPAELASLAGV